MPEGSYVVVIDDVSTPPERIGGRKALALPGICRFDIVKEEAPVMADAAETTETLAESEGSRS